MTIPEIIYSELTSTRKLTSSSTPRQFRRWKSMIEFVLDDANLSHVLSDLKPPDPLTDSSSEPSSGAQGKGLSDDERCRSILLFAMDDLLFDIYSVEMTAKQIMDSLARIYNPDSGAYDYVLFDRYQSHKMAEDTPINDHLNEMRAMAADLKHAGMPISERFQEITLMNSLPESWAPLKLTIRLRREENSSLEDLMERLRDAGEMRKEEESREDSEPGRKRQKTGKKGFKGNCYACGKPGHCQSDCPDQG